MDTGVNNIEKLNNIFWYKLLEIASMRRRRHMSPVPTARLARFFFGGEIALGFEGMRRRRHMSPVPTARLARFFLAGKLLSASRECVAADTCPRCPPRAWRAYALGLPQPWQKLPSFVAPHAQVQPTAGRPFPQA